MMKMNKQPKCGKGPDPKSSSVLSNNPQAHKGIGVRPVKTVATKKS